MDANANVELATMVERKAYALAFGYAAGSVVLALGAVFAGLIIMRKVLT